ncbi:porin [Chitinimonas prasina]|nr:porin [Chitinimonas prasina]
MQRSLLALALASAFAASAQAAEPVTVYGKMTLGVESIAATGATLANQNIERLMRVTDGASTLGFRGSEEINDDLTAYFQIETQIKPDDGCGFGGCSTVGKITALGPQDNRYAAITSPHTGTSRFANRPSFVGLRGSWGQIQMGRMDMYYEKHVPNELHLLRTGLNTTALAVLGSNQLSLAVGANDTVVAQRTFSTTLAPIVDAAIGKSTPVNATIAATLGNGIGAAYAQGLTPAQILAQAGGGVQALLSNPQIASALIASGVNPVQAGASLQAALGTAATQVFTPGSALNTQVLNQARAYTVQNGFYFVGHRYNNVVQYRSPAMNGLTVLGAVHTRENKGEMGVEYALDKTLTNSAAQRKLNSWGAELTFHYMNKGVFASLSMMRDNDPYSMGGALDSAYGIKAAYGMYFSPETRAGLVFERQVNKYNGALGYGDNVRDAWVLSGSHKVTPKIELIATYAQALDAEMHGAKQANSGARYAQLTGVVTLSPRTNLFATAAKVANESEAAYNFYVSGAAHPNGDIQSAQYTSRGADPTSFQVGINHNF